MQKFHFINVPSIASIYPLNNKNNNINLDVLHWN